jgi:hypothetical protein
VTEHSEALGLEQKCVMPGVWRIEGYLVVRYGYRSWYHNSIGWVVYPGQTTGYGTSSPSHKAFHTARTLAGARDWIHDHLGNYAPEAQERDT